MANINETLIEKYKNDKVLIKTYYADAKNNVDIKGIINPLRIDNRQLMSPTDNQGQIPGCAGWSACTLIESMYWKETGRLVQLDAAQVYARAKVLDGAVDQEGTYLETALQAAIDLIDIPSIKQKKIGLFYNNKDVGTIETTKFLIHKYDFLQVGFQIDEGWYNCNNKNYVLRSFGRSYGGHAVNLVGYDQDGFYVMNQWGAGFGSKGFCVMPYDVYLKELMYGAYLK